VHVIEVLPRRTALYRSNARGRVEPVLANLSLLLVVIAPLPPPDPFVADRYLAAAESAGIAATLVLNKAELGIDAALRIQLDVYTAAGYECMTVSATTGDGLDRLLAACAGRVAALVGQSGVGKSSLVRGLAPAAEVEIGGLMRDEAGRHTTTVS
jgi:ribosome biogenesis GTPase